MTNRKVYVSGIGIITSIGKNASENFDRKRTIIQALGQVFEVEIKECLLDPFYKSKKLKESLKPKDVEKLTKEILIISNSLEMLKSESRSEFYAFEDKVYRNPNIVFQVNIDKSFGYRLLELSKSAISQEKYETEIFSIRVEQGLEDISSEYRLAIYENIGKLTKIDWSKTKD